MFDTGTAWEAVPLAEAEQRYDIEAISDDFDAADLFMGIPERYYVHRGDVTIDGALTFGELPGAEDTAYVVDGDLTVNGPVRFENIDIYTPLFVTGTVRAQDLLCLQDSCLLIGGSLIVQDLLMTELSDAGHFVVAGSLTARTWLDTCGWGVLSVAGKPKTRLAGKPVLR